MPLKIHPPSHNHDSNGSYEKGPVPTLSESLRSFEGTAAESLIVKALQAEGIDPKTYNLDDYRMIHNNYRGLPSTEPAHGQADGLSPIVRAIYEGIENGTIVDEQISFLEKDVRVKKDSPNQFLNRLFLIDTSILRDAETGDAIAYTTGLNAEGGRDDYVICSTNDLDILDK